MIYDFTIFILASLVGNWIWDFWMKRLAAQGEKARVLKSCLEKIEYCSHELDYNVTPGIGGARCPFRTEAHQRLLYSEEVELLGEDLTKLLKTFIIDAGRANGESPSLTPGSVKNTIRVLKDLLQKRRDELKVREKTKVASK